jgi:signal transduction histidine kinase
MSVMLDVMRIQQILINFLSNAVKFSPKFESITVTVNAVRVSEGKV